MGVRGARRHPLVGPPRGFPHRSARPHEGAERQEHRHRAGRRQGRLLSEAPARRRIARRRAEGSHRELPDLHPRPARRHRQHREWQDRGAAGHRASRRRRSVPGGRRRQGHGHVLRHRQCHLHRIRPLARRRVRLGRLGRLRPQGHGHHRARRLGVRQAPLPRARRRHPVAGIHLRRHRRHVGRRVRQRHAAVEAHPAGGGVRSSAHLPRSESRRGRELPRARAPVQTTALELGRLLAQAHLARRRRVAAQRQVDSARPPRRARCSGSTPRRHAGRGDARHPAHAGRPAVERRHRHLREGARRDRTPRCAIAPTMPSAPTAARFARR